MMSISKEESVPKLTASYSYGLSIIYKSENDYKIFIEDKNQANLYLYIINSFFPDISINRIFPLYGKPNVLKYSKKNQGNSDEVYIVDKDFDDIFEWKETYSNLVYLDRYSIENFFLIEEGIIELVLSEKTELLKTDIKKRLNFRKNYDEICRILKSIVELHMIVVKERIPLECISRSVFRYINRTNPLTIKNKSLENYKAEIGKSLKDIDGRYTLNGRLKKVREKVNLDSINSLIKHIPGKYLVVLVCSKLYQKFSLRGISIESFTYRVAKESNLNELEELKSKLKNKLGI